LRFCSISGRSELPPPIPAMAKDQSGHHRMWTVCIREALQFHKSMLEN
jgi:hypothetical protein